MAKAPTLSFFALLKLSLQQPQTACIVISIYQLMHNIKINVLYIASLF